MVINHIKYSTKKSKQYAVLLCEGAWFNFNSVNYITGTDFYKSLWGGVIFPPPISFPPFSLPHLTLDPARSLRSNVRFPVTSGSATIWFLVYFDDFISSEQYTIHMYI